MTDLNLSPAIIMKDIINTPILKDEVFANIGIPSFFCCNIKNFKAFVLGADPSNFSDDGKPKILRTVFGIGEGDYRYFNGILDNLKQVGLGLDDIYVENLVRCYLKEETAKNKHWNCFAEKWETLLIQDFNKADKTKKVPVLLTTEFLYKYLLTDKRFYKSPRELYFCNDEIPIAADKNRLGRPLIPFYRHYSCSLKNESLKSYKEKIKQALMVL